MIRPKTLLLFLGLFAALLFIERPTAWLCDPDEARYAEIPQAMNLRGDYITPRLNGSNYFEKPPLLYWCNAVFMKYLGDAPYVARLSVRLATVATTAAIIFFLIQNGITVALWAGLIFLSSTLPFVLGRINLTDPLVSFGLTLALLSIRQVSIANRQNTSPNAALMSVGVGMAIGFLAKGVIGVALPALIVAAWCTITKEWKLIRQLTLSRATVVFIAIAAPWVVLMSTQHPGFANYFFIHEHLMRFATGVAKRPGPIYYFIPIVLGGLLPWTPLLWPALRPLCTHSIATIRSRYDELFFGLWFAIIIVFFSLSRSKLIPYVLPAFPAAAVLIARIVNERAPKPWLATTATWAVLYAALIYFQPLISEHRSLHGMAELVQSATAERVVAFEFFPHSFPLALKHPVTVVNFQGELASDNQKDPNLFWSEAVFWQRWDSSERIVAVMRTDDAQALFTAQNRKPHWLAQNKHYALAANYQ